MKMLLKNFVPALCAMFLAGCGGSGGGGGNPPPPPPPPPPAPSALAYDSPATFVVNVAVSPLTPMVTGSVTSYSVSPALPAGLAINAGSGSISGTPTAASAAANYVVTAANSGGSTTATVSITVQPAAPVVSYGGTTFNFTTGVTTNLTPTNTGGPVAFWRVEPALPPNVTLNTVTGVISATPVTARNPSNYLVTASSPSGNSTVVLTLGAVDPPQVSYPGTTYVFPTGDPVSISPISSGGPVATWSIAPALPSGLAFDTTNGSIAGTPTQPVARATYVVTAVSPAGTDTVNLSITVVAASAPDTGVLLQLGHTHGDFPIFHDGSRIMSGDIGSIVLWNAQTGAKIASTWIDCEAPSLCVLENTKWALHGPTAVIRRAEGFEVWSSVDGSVLASIASPPGFGAWWRLATDGSYIVGGNSTGLTVWSPTGTVLFTRSGDQSAVKAFAAAGDLRIANGPAGNNVIEHVAIPSGTSTVTAAFSGTFHSWFMDGESFFANTGNTVWIYSGAAVQRDLVALPSIAGLAGQGNWAWTKISSPSVVRLYRVGAGNTTPAATYPYYLAIPSTGTIYITEDLSRQFSIIDLSGAMPVKRDYTGPYPYINGFGAASASDWAFVNNLGVMLGELGGPTPTRYSLGEARSIAGSDSRIAVATASGSIFYFDANTQQLQGEIPFTSGKIQISADGNVLAASAEQTYAQYATDRTLKVFSLPSENVLAEWAHSYPDDWLMDFTMSRSGTVIGQVMFVTGSNPIGTATLLDGTPIWSQVGGSGAYPPIVISPNGMLIAHADGAAAELTATNIYLNGTLSSAASGYALGWVDDNRILLNRYSTDLHGGMPRYKGTDLVNASGQIVTSLLPLPELLEIQALSGNRVYSPRKNEVYDLTAGDRTWSSQAPHAPFGAGAVAGANVIFTSRATVRIEPL